MKLFSPLFNFSLLIILEFFFKTLIHLTIKEEVEAIYVIKNSAMLCIFWLSAVVEDNNA